MQSAPIEISSCSSSSSAKSDTSSDTSIDWDDQEEVRRIHHKLRLREAEALNRLYELGLKTAANVEPIQMVNPEGQVVRPETGEARQEGDAEARETRQEVDPEATESDRVETEGDDQGDNPSSTSTRTLREFFAWRGRGRRRHARSRGFSTML